MDKKTSAVPSLLLYILIIISLWPATTVFIFSKSIQGDPRIEWLIWGTAVYLMSSVASSIKFFDGDNYKKTKLLIAKIISALTVIFAILALGAA